MSKDFTYEGSTGPTVGEYELMGASTDGSPFGCILRREDGQTDYKELTEKQTVDMKTHADAIVGQRMDLRMEVMDLPDGVTITGYKWTIPDVKFKSWTPDQTKAVLETFSADDEDLERQEIQFYWVDAEPKMVKCVATRSDGGMDVTATANFNVVAPEVTWNHTLGQMQLAASNNRVAVAPALPNLPPAAFGLYNFVVRAGEDFPPANGMDWEAKVEIMAQGWPAGMWNFTQVIVHDTGTEINENGQKTLVHYPKGAPTEASPVLDLEYPYRGFTYNTGKNLDFGGVLAEFVNSGDSPNTSLGGLRDLQKRTEFKVYLMFRPPGTNSQYVPTKVMSWFGDGGAVKLGGNWSVRTGATQGDGNGPQATNTHPIWMGNFDGERQTVPGIVKVTDLPATLREDMPGTGNAFVRLTGPDGNELPAPVDLAIALVSSDPSRLKLITSPTAEGFVFMDRGHSATMFSYEVIDNGMADDNTEVTITASHGEYGDSSIKIEVEDNG